MEPHNHSRLTISLEEAGQRLGIGRSLIYSMARDGRLPTVRMGRRLLVPVKALEKLLDVGPDGLQGGGKRDAG